jgi:hypothetical protein
MLDKLFKSLRADKPNYLGSKKGSDFEDRIELFLRRDLSLNRINREDLDEAVWKSINNHLNDKLGEDFINLPANTLNSCYIYQPRGSQEFPDFLIFTKKKVIPLEIKYSGKKQSSPIWNSNIPKANAFYIFGSYGLSDITFFRGNDVLTSKHRKSLYSFFDSLKSVQDKFRKSMPVLDLTNRGFSPYIRAAFEQKNHKRTVCINFFSHPDRSVVERRAIEESSRL